MSINRRHVLASAALAGVAGALPVTVRAQVTTGGNGVSQVPAYQRMRVGDAIVTALSDGYLALDAGAFPTVSPESFAAALDDAFLPAAPYTAPVNAYAVQFGDRTVMIDAGGSTGMAPTLGQLDENMRAAGIDPASVETILITHLHPDHIGQLTENGAAQFPNAELVMRAEEYAFWTNEESKAQLPEAQRSMVDAVIATLAPYEGRVTRFDGDVVVADGIEAVSLPGHTPGHTGYRIMSGDGLFFWGDIIHVAPVQMPDPARYIGFDVDPEQAIETRRMILDRVAADRTLVAGMHLPFPGFGHVMRLDEPNNAYAFIPTLWQYEV